MTLEFELKAQGDKVNARLSALLPPGDTRPTVLHEAMRYSCLAPGKRLRPILCLACAQAVGSTAAQILDAACALEMVHCFSLIHDDLPAIDDDDIRRGLPTCHKRYGEAVAILAGDALFSLAFDVLSNVSADAARVLRCIQILTRASGSDGLVGGEIVDVLSEGQDISLDELDFIHSRKTGSLMSASCEIGAILGGASVAESELFRQYGALLGLAFQITDDVLNEEADPARLGKATGTDKLREKVTYATVHGLSKSKSLAGETVEKAVSLIQKFENRDLLVQLAQFTIERLH